MYVDCTFVLLYAIVDNKIVFVDVVYYIVSLPGSSSVCLGLGLFGF